MRPRVYNDSGPGGAHPLCQHRQIWFEARLDRAGNPDGNAASGVYYGFSKQIHPFPWGQRSVQDASFTG
jgi:hypothetical protein